MSNISGSGAICTTTSWLQNKPIQNGLLLPAVIALITCVGSAVAYVPTKEACDDGADKVAVVNGEAHWVGKWGEVAFGVANKPTPKNVCVTVLPKDKAAAFVEDRKFTWDRWHKEHQG